MTRICQKALQFVLNKRSLKLLVMSFSWLKQWKFIVVIIFLTEIVRRGRNNDYKSYIYYLKLYLLSYIHT